MPSKVEDQFITVQATAQMIGLSEKTVYQGGCKTDELLRVKLGRRFVFSLRDVQDWIARRKREAEDERRAQQNRARKDTAKITLLQPAKLSRELINKTLRAQRRQLTQ